MAVKIINPNWVDPWLAKVDQYRQPFIDYVAGLPTDQQFITFDEMRTHFNKTVEQFPDGEIQEILIAIGIAPEHIIHE